jgi:hypothetical protein
MKDMPFTMGKLQRNRAAAYHFSIFQILEEAWERVHGSKMIYWKAVQLFLLINLGLILLGSILAYNFGNFFKDLWFIIIWLVDTPMAVGFSFMGMRRSVNLDINENMVLKMYSLFWKIISVRLFVFVTVFILAYLSNSALNYATLVINNGLPKLLGLMATILGTLLFIASYYFALAFMFAPLLLVEKHLPIMKALKASIYAFNQHWAKIIVTYFIMSIILLLASLPSFIGLVWILPMFINLGGILYRIIFGVEEVRK